MNQQIFENIIWQGKNYKDVISNFYPVLAFNTNTPILA